MLKLNMEFLKIGYHTKFYKAHLILNLWIKFICNVICIHKNQVCQGVHVVQTHEMCTEFIGGNVWGKMMEDILRWILWKWVMIIEGICYWLVDLVLTLLILWHSSLVGIELALIIQMYSGVLTWNSIGGTRKTS